MDHPSQSSSVLFIIGASAFSRHRVCDPVFVIAVRRPVPEPDVEAVVRAARPVNTIRRPARLALPYRPMLQLTAGSTP